ncbi:zinc ribbon domain-containing protein [Sorangium cellulosum]|uniref:zinc ribbon domain-containing protein n=1 Tax=Sorangium cellulosum TaxID=56 RepID=UPI0010120495|nr:zinc ribbon domain-containing protein [Sorangium cellulosum]
MNSAATADETARRASDSALERQIVHYARFGAPFAALVGAGVAGLVSGPPAAILVLAGGALVAVIAIFWASLRVLLGETPLSGADAYAIGAPRVEEEQKQAVLRALKDLEFERSVGKISDEDYAELVARYRAEAKRLLRLLDADAQPRREQVAALVARRLRRAGLQADDGADGADEATARDEDGAEDAAERAATEARPAKRKRARVEPAEQGEDRAPEEADGERDERDERDAAAATEAGEAAQVPGCAVCGTVNDEDAVFCKKCGTRRAPSAAQAEHAAAEEAAGADTDDDRRRAS